MDNFIKSTITSVKVQKDGTVKRAKEIMAHFGESQSELDSIISCSNILKFTGQSEKDFIDGNGTTLTIELYNVLKCYKEDSGRTFRHRNEYHVHWIRNEKNSDGSYPQGDYTNSCGWSGEDLAIDKIKFVDKAFDEFESGDMNVEHLVFFGVKVFEY